MPSDLRLAEIATVDRGQDGLIVGDVRAARTHDFNARAREGFGVGASRLAIRVENLKADHRCGAPAGAEVAVVRHLRIERADARVVVEDVA